MTAQEASSSTAQGGEEEGEERVRVGVDRVSCRCASAMAYSATTVLPAEV